MKLLVHCENSILADEYKANLEAKGILCYIQKEEVTTDKIKDYIVYPELGDNAGVVGALALAMSVVK